MNEELNLDVGQIVYLLARKEPRVYPALVTEQINKKTLEGSSTSYVVRLPTNDSQEIELSRIDAEVFVSADAVRNEMLERATSQIDKILSDVNAAIGILSPDASDISEELQNNVIAEGDSNFATVDLGDGRVGKVNLETLDNLQGGLSE